MPSNSLRIATAASSAPVSPARQARAHRSALRLAVAEMQPAKAPPRASMQRGFGRGEHGEVGRDRRRRAGVSHVAGGILQTHDAGREGFQQPLDQRDMPGQAGHGREMIEIDRDRLVRRRLHQGVDIGDQPVVGHALVVERRQHQRAGKAELGRMAGERDRIGHRRGAGPDHQAVERQARPPCRRSSPPCARRARTRWPRRWCRAR